MNRLLTTFLLISIVLTSSLLQFTIAAPPPTGPAPVTPVLPATYAPPPPRTVCDDKCDVRCSEAGYKERCMKYCLICCRDCKGCVPSGPKANKSECPCYRDKKTKNDKPKCP